MRGLLLVVIVAATAWQSLGFEHEWTTVQEQMWGWMGDDVLEVEGQLEFFANNYRSGSRQFFKISEIQAKLDRSITLVGPACSRWDA